MFFNNKSKQNTKNNWNQLTDISQLDEIDQLSVQQKIIIFKHSTRCSISMMALKSFENSFDFTNKHFQAFLLHLLTYRTISNHIASKYNITHQSPQILVIEKGICTLHASHEAICELQIF
ncbi:MAG: bacillithiol system redox-active protein YtxJ [Flavobacterium sp.]